MPRPKSGNPAWEAIAVKLPTDMLAQVRRYVDLQGKGISISQLVRDGLTWRLQQDMQYKEYNGNVAIPPGMVTVLMRLASTLRTTAEELSNACQGTKEPEEYNGNTTTSIEEYNGNIDTVEEEYNRHTTLMTPAGVETPPGETTAGARPTDAAVAAVPPFDHAKHRLGKLCKSGHEWGTTGQSLRANNKAGYCLACNAALARDKRQARGQGVS